MRWERIEARVVVAMLGFAVLWVVLVVANDGTTFHLAPSIVAGFPVMVAARHPIIAAGIGAGGASAAAVLLWLGGLLDGPSLLPIGGAPLETLVAVVAGGLAALGLAVRGDRRSTVWE